VPRVQLYSESPPLTAFTGFPKFLQAPTVRFSPNNRFLTIVNRTTRSLLNPSDTISSNPAAVNPVVDTLGAGLFAARPVGPTSRGIISCTPRGGCTFTPAPATTITVISPQQNTPTNCPAGTSWDGTECASSTSSSSGTGTLDQALAQALLGGGSGSGAGAGQGIYVPPTQPSSSSTTSNPVLLLIVIAVIGGAIYWLWKRSKHKGASQPA